MAFDFDGLAHGQAFTPIGGDTGGAYQSSPIGRPFADSDQQPGIEQTHRIQHRQFQRDHGLLAGVGQDRAAALACRVGVGLLDDGKVRTISDIAQMEDVDVTLVRRLLRLALLAPTLVETIVGSNEQTSINLEFVLRRAMPADWQAQGTLFADRR